MNIPWAKVLLKELLFESLSLLYILLLYYFEIINNFDLIILFLLYSNEKNICNRFIMNKNIVYLIALKPVNIKTFFMQSSIIIAFQMSLCFAIILSVMLLFFKMDLDLIHLFILFVISMLNVIAVGNFISNSKLAYSYVFIGIPILRLLTFSATLSLSFFFNYLSIHYSNLVFTIIILSGSLFVFVISITRQTIFNSKYKFISLVKRKNENS